MDIPITFLTIVENGIVGVLLGASTIAVISYALCLKYGYPKEGVGNRLIQAVYTLIRLFHIFLAVLVVLFIIIFGIFDGVLEAQVEYGVKAVILCINALLAYGMARHLVPLDYAAPVIAAGWYFLASYHAYTAHIVLTAILLPFVWYLLFIIIFQIVFIVLRRIFIREHSDSSQNAV